MAVRAVGGAGVPGAAVRRRRQMKWRWGLTGLRLPAWFSIWWWGAEGAGGAGGAEGAEGEAVAGHAAAATATGSATDSLASSPLVPASVNT